jgi:hypothetical protein
MSIIETIIDKARAVLAPQVRVPLSAVSQTREAGDLLLVHKDFEPLLPPTNVQAFHFEDLNSFERFVDKHVAPERGACFHDDTRVVAVHDIDKPWLGGATYSFHASRQLRAWRDSGKMSPKEFRDFLQARLAAGELHPDGEKLFLDLAVLKLNAKIQFELTTEDQQTMGFVLKQDKDTGSTEIPKEVRAVIPLFEGDPDAVTVPWRISFGQPNPDNPRTVFSLDCPVLEVIWEKEVDRRVTALKVALEHHDFFRGSPNTKNANDTIFGELG